jgi:hypothetical protein
MWERFDHVAACVLSVLPGYRGSGRGCDCRVPAREGGGSRWAKLDGGTEVCNVKVGGSEETGVKRGTSLG